MENAIVKSLISLIQNIFSSGNIHLKIKIK
jgi:hypothetical protein